MGQVPRISLTNPLGGEETGEGDFTPTDVTNIEVRHSSEQRLNHTKASKGERT